MKFSAALSILALGVVQAKIQEAEKLEKTFERVLGKENRDLHSCCTWVCEEPAPAPEPEPAYRSKGMMNSGYGTGSYRSKGMMGGSGYYDDDGYSYGSYGRRTEEQGKEEQNGRKLPYVDEMDPNCALDCSSCEDDAYPYDGYQCFPTMSNGCKCMCCGSLPPPVVTEPEPEPEPVYSYRSKAMMMGYSRRTKETPDQRERALPGKGYGGGSYVGPSISCECACDPAAPKSGPGSNKSGGYSMKSGGSKQSGGSGSYYSMQSGGSGSYYSMQSGGSESDDSMQSGGSGYSYSESDDSMQSGSSESDDSMKSGGSAGSGGSVKSGNVKGSYSYDY
jgi:hypothetical protein